MTFRLFKEEGNDEKDKDCGPGNDQEEYPGRYERQDGQETDRAAAAEPKLPQPP